MALYTGDSKDRVRDAVDMEALVGARTELRRAGPGEMTGRCPFHDERTPSFHVNTVEKVYYCFGCQAAGDAFTFVQETEGVDFKRAMELLADRFGVTLEAEAEDPRAAERRRGRERLLELVERTTAFYVRVFWEADEAQTAREYLLGRGLSEESLREFRVGYSPSAWDRVLLASRRGGFSEAELFAAGLAQKSQKTGQAFDRFRGRIMFPLSDGRGRVLGFGARAMTDGQKPKYLNTAEGELFHKGRELYGAHLARAHTTKAGTVIVCEGYTDVVALHQAGLRNAVGIMGTAMTEAQVTELGRLAGRVVLALDADAAGQGAMLKAARVAEGRKLELRVARLPAGSDPADLVRDGGGDVVAKLVEESVPFLRFRVEQELGSGDTGSAEGRDRLLAALAPLFQMVVGGSTRDELVRLVAGRLELTEAQVGEAFAARGGRTGAGAPTPAAAAARGPAPNGASAASQVLHQREHAERRFIAICMALGGDGLAALEAVDLERDFSSALSRRAAAHVIARRGQNVVEAAGEDPELAAVVAELAVRAAEPATLALLAVERAQLELASVERSLGEARAATDGGAITALARRRADLKTQLDEAVEVQMGEG